MGTVEWLLMAMMVAAMWVGAGCQARGGLGSPQRA